METPKYLLVLNQYKWLLVVGLIISIGVGLLAGYTLKDGEPISRVERIYPASTTVLLSSPSTPLFQAEIPAEAIPIDPSVTVTQPVNLSLTDAALVYAYLVSGKDIQARVEDKIGVLTDTESITAVSRTTQPSGDENFPGRLSLPVLDVVAYSDDPARAELISRTTAEEFQDYVTEQQDARAIPSEYRVTLTTLRENAAGDGVGSNPAVPVIIGAGGTFAGFVALAFILFAARSSLARGKARKQAAKDGDAPGAVADDEGDLDEVDGYVLDDEDDPATTSERDFSRTR